MNIIDAYVDAHVFYFDVSDKAILSYQPCLLQNRGGNLPGVQLGLRF
ncbi:MAG: hypothetical protein IPO27_00490 [Bacteroidetes bacterium]|nr:hypothetical protein [Bacteroidota bacterium]